MSPFPVNQISSIHYPSLFICSASLRKQPTPSPRCAAGFNLFPQIVALRNHASHPNSHSHPAIAQAVLMASLSSTPSSFYCTHTTLHLLRPRLLNFSYSCPWRAVRLPRRELHSNAVLKKQKQKQKQKGFGVLCCQVTSEASNHEGDGSATGLATLEQFIQLNSGSWSGSFTQYDVMGNVLQCIPTRLSATSYGKGENVSLLQTLHIKEATSKSRTADEGDEPVWQEFKLVDTNLFTMEQRQQVGFFPGKNAYTVSHQTSEMLDKVLRIGVLGEDDEEEEEFPKGVKLPSRRPALVCESCLYSKDAQRRVRAFHVLDPRGLLDVIGVFHESRDGSSFAESQRDLVDEPGTRIQALLGRWSGELVTQRTGIYGSTSARCNVLVCYERDEEARMKLEIKTDRGQGTRIAMNGASLGNIMRFEGGLLTTMLPGGLAMTCPGSVGQSVGRKQAFYFEVSWIESPGERRRLVRTYDTDGLVVSTSLATESKLSS